MSIPEGATHKAVGPRIDCWYRNINCLGFEFMNQGGSKWLKRDGTPNWPYERIANDHKQWSGPQDGLPPVGMSFEFKGLKHKNQDYLYALKDWHAGDIVTVAAHVKLQGEMSALYWNENKMSSSTVRPDLLERLKTPDQLAAEQRETAIREIMDVAGIDCLVTATKLVDAGFKREVV